MRQLAEKTNTARRRILPGSLFVAFALAMAACGDDAQPAADTTPTGIKGTSEAVRAEPVSSAGDNPFTASVGEDEKGVRPPKQAASSDGPTAYEGNLPGLYGGTMDHATCDAAQLVTYLERTPSKAAAWAAALSIDPDRIEEYVDGLTAVTLRTDTRITNHGYAGGRATPVQAVLQAGTAVFVDGYGTPVVKCYCGNPLTRPITYTAPVYTGPVWRGFSPDRITIIKQTITVIKVFELYDLDGGGIFRRPLGTDGSDDVPPGGDVITTPAAPPTAATPAPSTPAPATPEPSPTPDPSPSAPAEDPSASFSPNPGRQGDQFTLSIRGFAPGITVQIALTRPDGVEESYSVSLDATGGADYSFSVTGSSTVTGTYVAAITNPQTGATTQASVQVDPG